MEVDNLMISQGILTSDEWLQVPPDIGKKVQAFIEEKLQEYITSKALYEAKKSEIDEKFSFCQNELAEFKKKFEESEKNAEFSQKTIEELESQISSLTSEITKSQETCNRLEAASVEYRRQCDLVTDERDSLLKMLERRNMEIERLQMDLNSITQQLNASIASKCEALAKMEEATNSKLNLEMREKQMEQQKALYENQIKNLFEDLNKRTTEIQNLRHENTTSLIILETKLSKKTEELRIANETIASLTAAKKALNAKTEELTEKMKMQRDAEIKLHESFNHELQAQTRLAELYKTMTTDNNAEIEELKKAVSDLQTLLQNASEQYGELETKHKETLLEHEEVINRKDACVILLKSELDKFQDTLKILKDEATIREIESISPGVSSMSRLLRPSLSVTQMYSQIITLSDELMEQKAENKRLSLCIQKISQELEERNPIINKYRTDLESAFETIADLTKSNDQLLIEVKKVRDECLEIKNLEEQYVRENDRLNKEVADLSRQVCVLLKEIEGNRGNNLSSSSDNDSPSELNSSDLISKRLVTFKNIQELQQTNQKLLAVVRDLSAKQEEYDALGPQSFTKIVEKLEHLRNKQKQMLATQESMTKMMDQTIKQRDLYRNLYQKLIKGSADEDTIPMDQDSNNESETQTHVDSEKERKLMEIEEKLTETVKQLELITEEYETYKKEKNINDKIMSDQLEQFKKENRELLQLNCKLSSVNEYNEEKCKILKQNTEVYKNQIAALEDKNKTYNNTIIKHEQSLMHLKDEVLNAQSKLSRAEVGLQNIQQECRLLRDSESRLLKEKEILIREGHGQNLLLTNLETIKISLERSEQEGKMRLENRLDEALRECSALRRRLQEEQDKFRELSVHLEKQVANAQQRMEVEKQQADHFREELSKARDELVSKTQKIEELSKKVRNSNLLSHTVGEEHRIKELERQLNECQEEINVLKQQLMLSKENISQYCNIAENAEIQLKEELENNKQYKERTESELKANVELIESLKNRLGELEAEMSLETNSSTERSVELSNELSRIQEELKITQQELLEYKENLNLARNEVKSLAEAAQIAEDKYAREMMLHSSDLQALTTLKEELSRISNELNETRAQRDQAIENMNINKEGWAQREKLMTQEKEELENRLSDLDKQNKLLYDQIQALSNKLSVLHSQQTDMSFNQSSGDSSFNKSFTEDEVASSEQLLQLIKFIRKEKELAIAKAEVLDAENKRLDSQLKMIESDLKEAKEALAKERQSSEASIVTAAKHSEILRKVETLNAITDSNKILRDERDAFKIQVNELSSRANALENQLAPLQEKIRELNVTIDALVPENQSLKAEASKWRQRANALIEKSNKINPDDYKRLQNERDNLIKLLNTEKDALKRRSEELDSLKQEKLKVDERIGALSAQTSLYAKDIKKLSEEVQNYKVQISRLNQEVIEARETAAQRTDENTKITEDLASKDVMLTDIRAKETQVRKIAKKYKMQYEELAKAVEEQKQKSEEKSQTLKSEDVPPEIQESFREEGRREIEQRIAEIERINTERVTELTNQISSSQKENETLKNENNVLKSNENDRDERTKTILKAARLKITDLTEERNKIKRQLDEYRTRIENAEQNNDDSRISQLEKERNEAIADRDRCNREIDALNQRINQLQRQLGLPLVSKPSTSSASADKSGSEPPTANIKPLPGHSNSQQQSATVMPWRGGETPFASIRPMSQLRTVAVLPTSQNSGNTNVSTAVLVPPQQQIVHTTGNSSLDVMSSSPTSSHTDYMPATSSASPAVTPIRQVAVPPTQQATIGMSSREEHPSAAESTQDMESETENQQPIMQQQQQAVAMVLPRIEQQSSSSSSQSQNVEQSTSTSAAVVASSQQASSSNTVTTTQAGHKRPRETEGDSPSGSQNEEQSKMAPQTKRTRTQASAPEVFQVGVTDSGVEVEYQVPTSSQRDQEDDVIVLSEDEGDGPDEGEGDGGDGEEEGMMMEADDDATFEGADGDGDGYGIVVINYDERQITYDDADCQDMEDAEPVVDADDPNNEVDVIDDSSEVPNQSGSNSNVSIAPEQSGVGGSNGEDRNTDNTSMAPATQTGASAPQSEAISSGSEGTSNQATTSNNLYARNRNVTRQQQQLLLPHGYEEVGDDGIVPSTPTLYVPRRTDGFGEAVSSPHVPIARFTFNDASGSRATSQIVSNEGLDDARVDLSHDESGTGRSVPSTPLQVSPQGEQTSGEGNAEVAPSIGEQISEQMNQSQTTEEIPAITVTEVGDEAETSNQEANAGETSAESPPEGAAGPSGSSTSIAPGLVEIQKTEDLLEGEEGTDGVSSEGEKQQTIEDTEMEEGREAEAAEAIIATESPSSNTRSRSTGRGVATARRSNRVGFRSRSHRPTPIVWNSPSENSPSTASRSEIGTPTQDAMAVRGRNQESQRSGFGTRHRARRMRQMRPFNRY